MKIITLNLLIIFASLNLLAQKSDCDGINKTHSELKETTYYKSNAVWLDKATCLATFKIIAPNINSMALVLTNYSNTLDVELKGVYLKFDDGTFYRNSDTEIEAEANEGESKWKYKALIFMKKDLINRFKERKISTINFGYSGHLTLTNENADTLIKYIKCIDESN